MKQNDKRKEFEVDLCIAIISWFFGFLILMSGLFIVIFEGVQWEKILPTFWFLFTVAVSLGIYYTYKANEYLKNERRN